MFVAPVSDIKLVDIDKRFRKKENNQSYFTIFSNYVQGREGTQKLFKLLIDGFRWTINFANNLGLSKEAVNKLVELQGKFMFINKNLIIVKYPKTLTGLNNSFYSYMDADSKDLVKNKKDLISRVTKIIQGSGYSDLFKKRGDFISKVAQAIRETEEIDLVKNRDDLLLKVSKIIQEATDEDIFKKKDNLISKVAQAIQETKDNSLVKKRDDLLLKTAQTIADSSFLLQLGEILALYTLGSYGAAINLIGNFFILFIESLSLKMTTEEYFENENLNKIIENQSNPPQTLLTVFFEKKTLSILNLAKTITSIVVSTFLILEIVLKAALISTTCLLMLSTVSTVLSIWTHFYKESMTYQSA